METRSSGDHMRIFSTLLFCLLAIGSDAAESSALKLVQTIPLPGVKGRFDHFAVDAKKGRVFAAALGNNTLEVFDVNGSERLKSVGGLNKPAGVVFLPEPNQIGVANARDGTFKLFDAVSYQLLNSLGSLDDADNLRRDPETKLIYLGYGDGGLAVLDSGGRNKLADIKLSAHPEAFQLEAKGPRIFVNVPHAKQVAVVDREKRTVTANWPMEASQANYTMALDELNHRLFVGCRKPPRIVVVDTESGKSVTDFEISGDTDDLFFDAKRGRIYVSCGEGFLDIIQRRDGDHYERIAHQPTRAGARTCFYSPDLDRLFLAVPQRDDQEAELRIYQPE
jgi:DNA-binding beta-propeller fold protein YncE